MGCSTEIPHLDLFYICDCKIAILAGLLSAAATHLIGRHGAWIAILGLAAYTILVSAGASVVRAAIMGDLALTAPQIGRRAAPRPTGAADESRAS
jgi:hypothetical protein